jgi:hypothetical protein
MATSYTSLLGFALPVTGELNGTWGDVVNNSITELVEDSIAGSVTASVTSADWTLTTTGSGAANQARAAILIPTGTPGTARSILAPNSSKAYIVNNQSDSTVTVKGVTGPTTGAAVAAGTAALVAWNGSDFVLVSQALANATGTLPVSKGGTGATTLTANNVILGNGTSAVQVVAPGTSGNVLTSDGTTWASTAPAPGGIDYVYKTANYTVSNNEGVLADTSGGAFTVTLPATPAAGDQCVVADAGAAFGTNNLIVARNGSTIGGVADNLVLDITGVSVQFVYDGTTWEVYAQIGGNGGAVVTLDGVQTLTNKTINLTSNTLVATSAQLATAVTDETGSGALVFGTSPTLASPTFNDGYTEEVFAVSGTTPALSPANGSIQTWTLSGNSTPTAGTWNAGQSITLMIDDDTAYTVTWTSLAVTWKTDGGDAPTLNTSGYTVMTLWKVGTTIYGARVGDA